MTLSTDIEGPRCEESLPRRHTTARHPRVHQRVENVLGARWTSLWESD